MLDTSFSNAGHSETISLERRGVVGLAITRNRSKKLPLGMLRLVLDSARRRKDRHDAGPNV